MTVIVPHKTTQQEAIAKVDKSAAELFDLGGALRITNAKKTWNGPRMDFSLNAGVGFISLPISGHALVDPTNVTIEVELPTLAKNFIGEDKIRQGVEQRVRGLLEKGSDRT